jgi:hypothetical protein
MADTEPMDSGNIEPDIESFFLGDVTVPIDGTESFQFGEPIGEFVADEPMPEPDDSLFGDISQPVGDGTCDVCGAPTFRPPGLTSTGRKKRVPRRCELHSRRPGQAEGAFVASGVESQLRRVQEELADDLRLLGTLAGPLFPVTGYYVFEHADPFTIAILKLAKNNTRILRVLHRAAQVAPIYTVAECIAGTAYAVQVDTKKADPHNMVGQRLGVSRAYDAVYPEEAQDNVMNNGFAPPPHYGVGVQ